MPDTDDLFTSLFIESDKDKMRKKKRKINEIQIDEMINMLNNFIDIYDLTDRGDPYLSNKTEKILSDSGLLTSNIKKNKEIDDENLKKLNDFLSQMESLMYYPRFNDYIRNNKDKLLSILLSIQTDYYIPSEWLGYDRGEQSPPARLRYKIQNLDNIFCKFGRMCYQRNPDHIKRFEHPHSSDKQEEPKTSDKQEEPKLFVMGTTDGENLSKRRQTARKPSRTRIKQKGGNRKNKTKKKRKKYTKKKRKYNKK